MKELYGGIPPWRVAKIRRQSSPLMKAAMAPLEASPVSEGGAEAPGYYDQRLRLTYPDIAVIFERLNNTKLFGPNKPLDRAKLASKVRRTEQRSISPEQRLALRTLDSDARQAVNLRAGGRAFLKGYALGLYMIREAKGQMGPHHDFKIMRSDGFYGEENESTVQSLLQLAHYAREMQPELCNVATAPVIQAAIAPFKPPSESAWLDEHEQRWHLEIMQAGIGLAHRHLCENLNATEEARNLGLGGRATQDVIILWRTHEPAS